jgi:hypothetical protein
VSITLSILSAYDRRRDGKGKGQREVTLSIVVSLISAAKKVKSRRSLLRQGCDDEKLDAEA